MRFSSFCHVVNRAMADTLRMVAETLRVVADRNREIPGGEAGAPRKKGWESLLG